jgi:hypothetical protein
MKKINNKFIRLSAAISLMAFLLVPTAAHAQFPGTNGRIIWTTPLYGQYTIKPDGTDLNATTLPSVNVYGTDRWQSIYTPNGQYIITIKPASAGLSSNLYVTNAAHTLTPVPITTFTTCNVVDPAANSTGTKIAFNCDDNAGVSEMYVIDLVISGSSISGANQIKLTNLINDTTTSSAVWSPDNSEIFALNGLTDIISISPTTADQTTGDETLIYNDPQTISLNDINPAGTKLLYKNFSDNQLYTVNVDGTSSAKLSQSASYAYTGGYYSPDGTKVVAGTSGTQRLVIMNATTGGSETVLFPVGGSTVGVQTERPMWGTNQQTFSSDNGGGSNNNGGTTTPAAPNTASAKKFSKNYSPVAIASAAATLFVGLLAYFGISELKRRKK